MPASGVRRGIASTLTLASRGSVISNDILDWLPRMGLQKHAYSAPLLVMMTSLKQLILCSCKKLPKAMLKTGLSDYCSRRCGQEALKLGEHDRPPTFYFQ